MGKIKDEICDMISTTDLVLMYRITPKEIHKALSGEVLQHRMKFAFQEQSETDEIFYMDTMYMHFLIRGYIQFS